MPDDLKIRSADKNRAAGTNFFTLPPNSGVPDFGNIN